MSIHLVKKSNNFTHKRTFLSALTMINKKLIANFVEQIWDSNLSQNPIHTMTNNSHHYNFRPKNIKNERLINLKYI